MNLPNPVSLAVFRDIKDKKLYKAGSYVTCNIESHKRKVVVNPK